MKQSSHNTGTSAAERSNGPITWSAPVIEKIELDARIHLCSVDNFTRCRQFELGVQRVGVEDSRKFDLILIRTIEEILHLRF
jgi:hypothetical protein